MFKSIRQDIKSIKELCLKADDLWLKCSSCSVGTKVFAVCNASKYLYELEEAQNTALKKGNVNLKQNDLYFKKAFDFFELEEKDFISYCEFMKSRNGRVVLEMLDEEDM